MKEEVRKAYCFRLLDVFKRTIAFLEANNIRWYAAYGTLIGAVRHKGLIPWDDDIDIWVPREDYERLLSMNAIMSSYDLELHSLELDRGYYLSFAKICDVNSTVRELKMFPFVFGCYIDVFPLDRTNSTLEELNTRHKLLNRMYKRQHYIVGKLSFKDYVFILKNGFVKEFIEGLFCRICSDKATKQYIESTRLVKDEKDGTHVVAMVGGDDHIQYFREESFASYLETPFEDFYVRIPSGYHDILTQEYGDYMTPPPEKYRYIGHEKYYLNLKEKLSPTEVEKRLHKGEKLVY